MTRKISPTTPYYMHVIYSFHTSHSSSSTPVSMKTLCSSYHPILVILVLRLSLLDPPPVFSSSALDSSSRRFFHRLISGLHSSSLLITLFRPPTSHQCIILIPVNIIIDIEYICRLLFTSRTSPELRGRCGARYLNYRTVSASGFVD